MSVATFDTHAAVRALEEAGMDTPQAEAVTETVRTAVVQGVATKADIADLRTEVKTDIADLRTEVKADIADLRTEVKADIADLRTEVKADIADLRTDLEKLRADLTWRMVLVVGALLALATALDRLLGA